MIYKTFKYGLVEIHGLVTETKKIVSITYIYVTIFKSDYRKDPK